MMDNSYSKECFDFLCTFYEILGFPSDGMLNKMWRSMGKVHGKARYGVSNVDNFRAGYVNASGRDDTAVNNAVVNAWLIFVGVLALAGVRDEAVLTCDYALALRVFSEIKMGVVGDDLLGKLPERYRGSMDRFTAVASEAGFSNKLQIKNSLLETIFLGCRPYPCATKDGSEWRHSLRFGKQLGRSMYKMGWQRCPTVDRLAWGKGNAWASLIADPHVPILRAYCLSILRKTNGVGMKISQDIYKKIRLPEAREIVLQTPDTYAMMHAVYGVSVSEIDELEAYLLADHPLPSLISHRTMDRIFMVDWDSM